MAAVGDIIMYKQIFWVSESCDYDFLGLLISSEIMYDGDARMPPKYVHGKEIPVGPDGTNVFLILWSELGEPPQCNYKHADWIERWYEVVA